MGGGRGGGGYPSMENSIKIINIFFEPFPNRNVCSELSSSHNQNHINPIQLALYLQLALCGGLYCSVVSVASKRLTFHKFWGSQTRSNAGSALGETDYGYKQTIHNRPVGQSMPNCSSRNIFHAATILCYKTIEIEEVKFVKRYIRKHFQQYSCL